MFESGVLLPRLNDLEATVVISDRTGVFTQLRKSGGLCRTSGFGDRGIADLQLYDLIALICHALVLDPLAKVAVHINSVYITFYPISGPEITIGAIAILPAGIEHRRTLTDLIGHRGVFQGSCLTPQTVSLHARHLATGFVV